MYKDFKSKMLQLVFLFLCVGTANLVLGGEDAIWKQITIPVGDLGDIVGAEVVTSKKQNSYYTFTGIPYADPTSYTGDKRFEVKLNFQFYYLYFLLLY